MVTTLRVEPVEDDDMPRCMELANAAFDFVPAHTISHGKDTPEDRIRVAQLHLQGQREHMEQFPSAPVCIKCVHTDPDTGTQKIVGYAEWYLYDRIRTAEEICRDIFTMRYEWMEDGPDREQCLAFVRPGHVARQRRMGTQRYGHLRYMCVDRGHRRQGIGSLVVRWGMDRCAELGIPAYLESSVGGMAMYTKLGFEAAATMEDETYSYPAMIWWPPLSTRGG